MIRLYNNPDDIILEMLEGYLIANPGKYRIVSNASRSHLGLVKKEIQKDRVQVIVGGGSGNEPWILGYVGEGLADGAVMGALSTAPPARAILNVTREIAGEKGALYICANYTGDVLNFELAGELSELEGVQTKCIMVADDIASAGREQQEERRGTAGVALVVKIAGAAAGEGLDLMELARLAQKANENIFTFNVTTSSISMAGNGKELFSMPVGEIEYGMGFNGETGVLHTEMKRADEVAETMVDWLVEDAQVSTRDEIVVMISGYRFTGCTELYIVARKIAALLKEKDINVYDMIVGDSFTPQGAAGIFVTVMKLDEELKEYYDMQAASPLVHIFRKE